LYSTVTGPIIGLRRMEAPRVSAPAPLYHRAMKRLFIAAALVLVTSSAARAQGEFRARVTEVHTGNTVTVRELRGRNLLVRLEGVDVPGRWRPFAARSRESLRALTRYKLVTVIPRSHDRHGRMTATILVDEVDVGLEQIRRGMGWVAEGVDRSDYATAEADAERAEVGVWSQRR
jgi:endonuclease YncB( thermonuclease family)